LPECSGKFSCKLATVRELWTCLSLASSIFEIELPECSGKFSCKLATVRELWTCLSLASSIFEIGNCKFKKDNYAEAKDNSQFEHTRIYHLFQILRMLNLDMSIVPYLLQVCMKTYQNILVIQIQKDNYAEAKDNSQFGTYEDLSPISNIEDAKLIHVHSSPKDNSQFGTYEDLSPISNIEDAKLRHVHSSRTVASLHENLPEHSGNSKFKKDNYAEAKDNSQFGTYEDLSPISNIEDAKLIHVHSSRTVQVA
ncbi:hypothetical protein Avbf_17056, partial [Armadillidium vulgare]